LLLVQEAVVVLMVLVEVQVVMFALKLLFLDLFQ
jgi:hypothetical protein